jgi:hypothetical protein
MTLENAAAAPANPQHRREGDLPQEIPRDRWGRPKIILPGDESKDAALGKAYTRASTLGGVLEDQTNLGEWKKRVVAYGLARRRDLILAAASVPTWDGLDDKKRLAEIAEQAMQSAEAGAAATIGTAIHALADRLDMGEEIPDVGEDRYALDAYAELRRHFTVHAIEIFTVCDELEVAGTADRVLSPLGIMTAPDGTKIRPEDRLIDDLKTSSTAQYFGIKFAVQLAVYAHGIPYEHGKGRLDWPDGRRPRQDWGLIMHVPSGGSAAQLHWVNLQLGWELARLAVSVREWRRRKDLVVPAELPRPDFAEHGESGEQVGLLRRIEEEPLGADLRDRLTALWRQHARVWTDQHTKAVEKRLASA